MATQPFARVQGFAPGSFAPTEVLLNPLYEALRSDNSNPVADPFVARYVAVSNAGGTHTSDIQLPGGRFWLVDAKVVGEGTAVAGDAVEFGVIQGVTYTKLGEFDLFALTSTPGLISRLTELLADSRFRTAGPLFNYTTQEWERNPSDTFIRVIFTQAGGGTTAACTLMLELLLQQE